LTVVATDFIAAGATFATVAPPGGAPQPYASPILTDVVVEWFRTRGGRLRAAEFLDVDRPRWELATAIPISCPS
jgi:hypothetical protein